VSLGAKCSGLAAENFFLVFLLISKTAMPQNRTSKAAIC
jgi:hypothetical protein